MTKVWTIERLAAYLQGLNDAGFGECEVSCLPDIIDPSEPGSFGGVLIAAQFRPTPDKGEDEPAGMLNLRYGDVDDE